MKNNIILLYILYVFIVYLLFIIDISIIIYYIFWINNIFICPLIWLWIKIIYYNRTVLLLLLFYYFIAKFTIKELGYKYFYFFNIDIREWRSTYLNYIWNITAYHIEIISILLFFLVIITPLFIYNKEIFFLGSIFIIFFLSWLRLLKNRLKYIKEKRIRIRSLIFFLIITIIFFKYINYQYIKEYYTMYLHLDKWVFELLDWKIQMYDKIMEKDYYSETVGLKNIWVGDKFNKKETIDMKYWEFLSKKKKFNYLNELKYKLKRQKKKYYLYTKYYERVVDVKTKQSINKIIELRKDFFLKNFIIKKKSNSVYVKDYTPMKNIRNENPVVTQEKEKERALHSFIISSVIQKFSLKNYYHLNYLLKNLTYSKLYYQPFIDKKGIEKQIIEEKKLSFSYSMKEYIKLKEELQLLKKIINKIKKNDISIKKINTQFLFFNNNDKNIEKSHYFFEKWLNYFFLKKEIKKNYFSKNFIKFYGKNKNLDNKLNMKKFLDNCKNDIKKKEKLNKLSFFFISKTNILDKDKLEEKKKNFCSFPEYIERDELEKIDNQLLFNTVKKYNEEKTKENWNKEFNEFFILKEKKENLTLSDTPDLSRRNKK